MKNPVLIFLFFTQFNNLLSLILRHYERLNMLLKIATFVRYKVLIRESSYFITAVVSSSGCRQP
jgi:hypothetical protein